MLDYNVFDNSFNQIPGCHPREVREQFNITPGNKVVFILHKKTLRLVIVPPIEQAEGLLLGIDTDPQREEQDEER